ncbi:MAG: TlyA family RNA methyltransferase [Candidatus Sungbacteria bacterium]|nr:TlyA family RNA methyltransferase [Candidatus Sungbacteria bacterium]
MKKKRLDDILIKREIVKDKSEAFILVTEGRVFASGQKAVSPAQEYPADIELKVKTLSPYVGRGGFKLGAAFKEFPILVEGKVCADIGAATGGFTDVLLQNGAQKVYAIDTARGKLALKLREDSRVVPLEETNILYLGSLPEPIEFASVDVSFTSLRLVLPALKKLLASSAEVVALFKPQYEVEEKFLHHGIVEDENARDEALDSFKIWVSENGWKWMGVARSPILGTKGNAEYLIHLLKVQ